MLSRPIDPAFGGQRPFIIIEPIRQQQTDAGAKCDSRSGNQTDFRQSDRSTNAPLTV